MQIAFFAVSKLPKEERGDHHMAMKTCELLFRGEGRNLPGFMVGRQMTVTLCFFVIARVTTLNVVIGEDPNIFGVSDPIQKFFNMGFLGAIITTILASISWQLVASAFPLQFLSNPLVYVLLRIALAIEATGFCSGAWFLGIIHKKVAGFQLDEVYVGTPEERAAMGKSDMKSENGDDVHEAHLGTNVLNLPPGAHHIPSEWANLDAHSHTYNRERILKNIKDLRAEIKAAMTNEEREVFEKSLKMEVKMLKKINDEQEAIMGADSTDVEDVKLVVGSEYQV
jgi:hypothetical protein